MRTEAQIAASRANGAKSRGPITSIGRAISAQNSATRGLAGANLVVIEGESSDRWQALLEACHREFQPETDIETELVTEIAAARWRLRRCWSMETSLFDMEIAKQRETPEFEPMTTSPSTRQQPATSATTCGSWTAVRPACGAATSAVENLYQLRARRNRKFPNEPKNSGE